MTARRWRPRVSTFGALADVVRRFVPPYRIDEEDEAGLWIRLRDPDGRHPDITLRHRHDRRLFLKANYLVAESTIRGNGPSSDGEMVFRFRGPFSRQRATLRWRSPVAGGEEWTDRLEEPLRRAIDKVEAMESLRIVWSARTRTWRFELKTLSGSVVGGFMSPMPIVVPLDPQEAEGVIEAVDALAATGGMGDSG